MRLHNSIGPNPRVVRMFAAEKGVALELVEVDIIAGENRREPYLSINPLGATPALALDGGQVVTETMAICEYLDETRPGPSPIGETPEARAATRMWARRIDLGFAAPLTLAFRAGHGRALFASRLVVPEEAAAASLQAVALDGLDFVERRCRAGLFVGGDAFTLADMLLFCFVDFAATVGVPILEGRPWLAAWRGRIAARPSAAA